MSWKHVNVCFFTYNHIMKCCSMIFNPIELQLTYHSLYTAIFKVMKIRVDFIFSYACIVWIFVHIGSFFWVDIYYACHQKRVLCEHSVYYVNVVESSINAWLYACRIFNWLSWHVGLCQQSCGDNIDSGHF